MTKITPKEISIKIPLNESKLFKSLANQYSKTPTPQLKAQMYDVFVPYLKSIAQKAAKKSGVSVQDYFQELSLKFLKYLESAVKTKTPASLMLYRLLRVKPSEDDIMSFPHKGIETISPEIEAETLSYDPEEQTLLQKVKMVTEIAKSKLSERMVEVLSMFLDDMKFSEISKTLGVSLNTAYDIYYAALDKIRGLNRNGAVSRAIFEDTPGYEFKYGSRDMTVTEPKCPPDKIWGGVEKYYDKTAFEELDSMLKTQTTCKALLTSRYTQALIKKKLKENPNFKIRLVLNRKTDNDKFKKEATLISIEMFGKNIFEFVN